MPQSYVYSIENDTANGVADAGSLNVEIQESSILIAVDSITTAEDDLTINFKGNLGQTDEDALDVVVADHQGVPLVDPELVQIEGQEYDASGHIVQRAISQKTQDTTMSRATHDFCNKTTWYSDSVRVTDEILTMDTPNIYSAANDAFIDVENGVIHRQDIHQQYAISVSVDGVVQTSGYTVNHSNGTITFDVPPVGEVTCSYSYPTTSVWKLPVNPGKLLVIEHSEVQFTDDVSVNTPLVFEIWVDNPFFGVPGHPWELIERIPGETIKYNSIRDIINESNLGYTVPSMPDIGRQLIIFPFHYVGEKIMSSSMNAVLHVYSESNIELTGTYGTATFYLIERPV